MIYGVMSKNMNDSGDISFGYYLVAFVDLLGQRQEMKKFTTLPDKKSGPEFDEFIKIVKSSIGSIHNFQRSFMEYFDTLGSSESSLQVPDEIKDTFKKLNKTDIKFQRFSDGLVIFVSLKDREDILPIKSIYGVLVACAGMMLLGLAKKQPIRGGLTVSLGAELNEGEIYGPAVVEAYELESEVAQYPRLVVGNSLCEYLDHFKKDFKDDDPVSAFNLTIANMCKQLLTYDFDGYPIINYMGGLFKETISKIKDYDFTISEARKYIHGSLEKYQREQNTKLAFRYNLLHSYFEHHLEKWDIKKT